VDTVLGRHKMLASVDGTDIPAGYAFHGYEMHVGVTTSATAPLLRFSDGRTDGAISPDGRIAGCYVHGLFASSEQRGVWLGKLGATSNGLDHATIVDAALDELAAELDKVVDIDRLLSIAQEARPCRL
jgi:adenosylcobyric acid synthase